MENCKLTFSDDALKTVVSIAQKKKTGARGLRNVIEIALTHVMFELPSKEGVKEVIITEKVITHKEEPEYITA